MIYKKFKEIDEMYYEKTLKSGLRVILIPRSSYNKKYAVLSVNVGSVDLKLKDNSNIIYGFPPGTAHFMEHILFENREGSIIDDFSQLGSSVNAYTSFNNTNYYFNAADNFYKSLNCLLSFVLKPHFDQNKIEHEKSVIKQEIKMYEDSPSWQSFHQLLQGLYYKYPIKYNIAGTSQSVDKINREILEEFFNKYYNLDNMNLIVIGDINHEKLFDWLTDKFSNFGAEHVDFKKIYPEEPSGIRIKKNEIAMSISRPIITLGFKENRCFNDQRKIVRHEMLSNMVLEMIFGKSNDNYHSLYDKNLIDENFTFNFLQEKNTGFVKIYGETSHINQSINSIVDIINNWHRKINKDDFEIVKHKYIGRYFRSLNSLEALSSQVIKYLNLGQNYFDLINIIESISLKDIIDQYNKLLLDQEQVQIIIRKISK